MEKREELQAILLEDFEIRWPGFRLRRVALNQHMPRVEKLSRHVHDYYQILLYLRGYGIQHLAGRPIPVQRGSALFVPPGCEHRFVKERTLRPVCLAIDFETEEALAGWREECRLSSAQLARIEKWLVDLHEVERADPSSLQSASLVLRLFAELERELRRKEAPGLGPVRDGVDRIIEREGLIGITPGKVADCFGCSLDHLNRQLRLEGGATAGELVRRRRLERAGQLLRTTDRSIGEVGSAVGIDDQNYFARWFRIHTGQTPSRWRSAMRDSTQTA